MPSRCAILIWQAITILEAESQARVVNVLDSRWVQSELGKSSSRSRADATGITLPLSTPLDPKVDHADLAWRRKGFLGGRRMKIKLRRLHGNERTVHAPMLLFARQVIRCGVSAKVLLKATLISGSRLGCFTYGWLTLSLWCSSCGLSRCAVLLSQNGLPDSILNAADIRMLTMSMPECQVWSIAACTLTSNKLTVHFTVNVLPGSNWSCYQAPAQSWANIRTGASGTQKRVRVPRARARARAHTHTHTHKQKHKHKHKHTHCDSYAWLRPGSGGDYLPRPATYQLGVRAYFGWTSLDWVVFTTRDVGDTMVVCATYLKYHRCRLSCLPFVWHFYSLSHTHARTRKNTRPVLVATRLGESQELGTRAYFLAEPYWTWWRCVTCMCRLLCLLLVWHCRFIVTCLPPTWLFALPGHMEAGFFLAKPFRTWWRSAPPDVSDMKKLCMEVSVVELQVPFTWDFIIGSAEALPILCVSDFCE